MHEAVERQRWGCLRAGRHAVLATIDDNGQVDLVPICYAVIGEAIFMPVDRVKPKMSVRLRRLDNLARRPRGSLLVEHYEDDDWTKLWWVRVIVDAVLDPPESQAREALPVLADKYPQYRPAGSVVSVVRFDAVSVTGWRSSEASHP